MSVSELKIERKRQQSSAQIPRSSVVLLKPGSQTPPTDLTSFELCYILIYRLVQTSEKWKTI